MSYCNYARLYQNCNGSLSAPTSSDRYLLPNYKGYYTPSITNVPNDEVRAGDIYETTSLPGNVNAYRYVAPVSKVTENFELPKVCSDSESSGTCGLDDDGHSVCGSGKLYSILDPKFNLRECAKNMILLEDHLFQKGKRCKDCILKHLLTIEGFLEEAITLDKNGEHVEEIQEIIDDFRELSKDISRKIKAGTISDKDCCLLAQNIRVLRKPLCQGYATFM